MGGGVLTCPFRIGGGILMNENGDSVAFHDLSGFKY